MRPSLVALCCVWLSAQGSLADPIFTPRAIPEHIYAGGWEHFVGGGVSAFDCDGDLMPDLVAAGGAGPSTLMRNRTSARGADLVFETDTPEVLRATGIIGAYPLDIDSDGHLDLAVLRVGENLLLQGDGACNFAPFADALGFQSQVRWTTAFSATWEDQGSLPTLAFGNYVDRTNPEGPFGTCDDNQLYRPHGPEYAAPMALSPSYCTLSMLFSDWGRHGRADLRVSNDRHYYVRGGQEQMWAMQDVPRLYTEADGWQSFQLWGMGIAARDITGDGLAELYLTSMGDQRFQFLQNGADTPAFQDAPFALGTSAHRPYAGGDGRPSTGWHAAFGDVQNDGRDDIFVTKGNVEQMPGSAMDDPNNLLIQTPEGQFTETGLQAGIATMERSRGAALIDLNLDGLLDLAVINRRAPMELYQNVTQGAGNWIQLRLRQPAPNVDAVGAFVEVRIGDRVAVQEVTVGGGHASGVAGLLHFGLGDATEADLRVIWPGGQVGPWMPIRTNQIFAVERDDRAGPKPI